MRERLKKAYCILSAILAGSVPRSYFVRRRPQLIVPPRRPEAWGLSLLMDQSPSFARHYARLVWLLMNEAGSVDEQKMSLRALVIVSKLGPVTLLAQDSHLIADEHPVSGALTGVRDVVSQMAGHSIARITIGATTNAADLLGMARILAAPATAGDGGSQVSRKLAALGAQTIKFATIAAPQAEVSSEAPTVVVSATAAEASAPAQAAPRAAQEAAALMGQLSAADVSNLTPDELLRALDAAQTAEARTKALDDLVSLAEHSVRIAKAPVIATIFHELVGREARLTDAETKRTFAMAIRRMSKPALLRAVATLIPKKPERKQQYYEILARAGEDGADAIIEQITQAPTVADRKQQFDVFRELDDAVPALTRMLSDSRWFVVRNAADLLGEMAAPQAEGALVQLLRHQDDRVRRSATNALMRLGTPDALRGIYEAVNDTSPEVRMQVAAAISTRKDSKTSATLIRAIEDEEDGDVQLAMISALGRVGTPDAVQKLVKMAEPEGRLFRKKTTSLRVAAVQALGEAKTPAALNALKELVGDKEREVRDTATRALTHAVR